MEKEEIKRYTVSKVENGYVFNDNGKIFVFESLDSVARDLCNGVLSRIQREKKIEFTARIIKDGE